MPSHSGCSYAMTEASLAPVFFHLRSQFNIEPVVTEINLHTLQTAKTYEQQISITWLG